MSNEQEKYILVPKHFVIVKTRSTTRNCYSCKHLNFFGEYGIHTCEKWNTSVASIGKCVCNAFCKRRTK